MSRSSSRPPGSGRSAARRGDRDRGDRARGDRGDRDGRPGERAPVAADELIEVGYVARAHGVRGELRVVTHDPASTTLFDVDRVVIDGRSHGIRGVRPVTGAVLLTLDGIADRDLAAALRGRTVAVERALVPLDDDEFFLADLVGCAVVLADGAPYGVVAAVDVGTQDRLVIHADGAGGRVERLLPLVPDFVESIDLDERRIVVSPPDGLPESPI